MLNVLVYPGRALVGALQFWKYRHSSSKWSTNSSSRWLQNLRLFGGKPVPCLWCQQLKNPGRSEGSLYLSKLPFKMTEELWGLITVRCTWFEDMNHGQLYCPTTSYMIFLKFEHISCFIWRPTIMTLSYLINPLSYLASAILDFEDRLRTVWQDASR